MEKYTGMSNQHTVRGKCDVYMNQTQPNYPAIYLVDQSLVEPKLALLLRASQTEGRPQKQSCRFLARSAISYFDTFPPKGQRGAAINYVTCEYTYRVEEKIVGKVAKMYHQMFRFFTQVRRSMTVIPQVPLPLF